MNNPHVHLLLNHVPTIGTVIAFGLLILSFIRRDEGLKRVSLEVFFVIAVLTLPAYITGVGTEFTFETNDSISKELMARHHDAALIASVFMLRMKHISSTMRDVYGSTSLTHIPHSPCCANLNLLGAIGNRAWPLVIVVRRCPWRIESGRSLSKKSTIFGL